MPAPKSYIYAISNIFLCFGALESVIDDFFYTVWIDSIYDVEDLFGRYKTLWIKLFSTEFFQVIASDSLEFCACRKDLEHQLLGY